MVKELRKEEKPRKKDIDNEYPPWPWVDYKFQDTKFFQDVKKLPIIGLDPKGDIIDQYVIIVDIAQIFGNVSKFRLINPLLLEVQKQQLERLY
jgi:hypothetical protein